MNAKLGGDVLGGKRKEKTKQKAEVKQSLKFHNLFLTKLVVL